MPVNPTYPEVYVQEIPSGVLTMPGVITSIEIIMVRAMRDTLNKPIQCWSFSNYEGVLPVTLV